MDTFWQTYLTREGEQPQAYDAEARALQGQMERRHLSTVELGTVIALPRGNLNDIWSYNDWYVSGRDLYRVHEFTRSGSTALDFIANMDNHTPSQERNGVYIPPGASGHVHVVPSGGPLYGALVPTGYAGVGSGTSSAPSTSGPQGGWRTRRHHSSGSDRWEIGTREDAWSEYRISPRR